MTQLEWSDDLALDFEVMDSTHQEFVDLLAAVQAAPDADLVTQWRALVAHTDDHFGREDQWMAQTGFSSSNCHSTQHQVVLQVLREGLTWGEQGDLAPIRQMASELVVWFPHHAQAMDAALAQHLRTVGFDPATGVVAHTLPAEPIHGCGGGTCSEPLNTPESVTV
jgi:hemerythrin-like metal-binding protein